jgi:hypothetical protein
LAIYLSSSKKKMSAETHLENLREAVYLPLHNLDELRRAVGAVEEFGQQIGTVNPRPPGWQNELVQRVKKLLARLLAWYTRPQREFNVSVARSLDLLAGSIDKLQTNLQAMAGRLPQLERDNTELTSALQKCMELFAKLESLANPHENVGLESALTSREGLASNPQAAPSGGLYDFDELRSAVAAIERPRNDIETVPPRPSGRDNDLIQLVKKLLARLLGWYTRPQHEFNLSVVRSLDILANSIADLPTSLQAMAGRLPQLERRNAALTSALQECMELFAKLESLANSQNNIGLATAAASMEGPASNPQAAPSGGLYDFDELRCALSAMERHRNAFGRVNPQPSGWYSDLIQLVKKLLARLLVWYTRPLQDFNASVSQSLEEIVRAVGDLSTVMVSLDRRFAQAERRSATLAEGIQEQLSLLPELVKAIVSLHKTAILEGPASKMETDWDQRSREISQFYIDTGLGNDRTAYLIGLFGTGRLYVNALMLQNIGERAKYFRDELRLHRGPTSMIYSGHATMRYVSRDQLLPAVMSSILETVRAGFADLIFLYRHPLDSLLTNWIWWRTYIHAHKGIGGISEIYKSTDHLCADLEQNFSEFKAFADGDPNFFAAEPGLRFLSFQEFVEETELHLQSATLALRLEDFSFDPAKEFSKIVGVMSVDLDLSCLCLEPPRAKPYRYLAVKEKVPGFRRFVDGLDAETKRRMERIGCPAIV